LDLVRVTESAALAAGRYVGRGDKNGGDKAAVDAMRLVMNTIEMKGTIVIGEGEKDKAPMLFNGEVLGTGDSPELDIAVDPIDGTRPMALGLGNTIATVSLAPKDTMFNPGPLVYMHKIAVGPEASDVIDLDAPVKDNLEKIARAKGKDVEDLTIMILNRDRNAVLIDDVRACGARIMLIQDGDVAGAIATCLPETGVDALMGIGGTPEGVLAACALRCIGGNMQGRLYARTPEEARHGQELGFDFNRVLFLQDMVSSEDVFFAATGITNGSLLKGVDYFPGGARTDSIVMRGLTGTIRKITATHMLDRLSEISSIQY
jgi:fructose-1,6-bisphosphatase II